MSYDDNGNMLSDGSMSYTWDGANRLIRVEQGENTYQHAYNGLGQRLKLTQNGVENRFLYDGQSQWVFGAMNVSTQATTRFVLGPMGLLSQQTGSSPLLSPMLDGQGSVRAVVSDAQVEIRRYSPHGSLFLQRGAPQTAYGFSGGYEDPSGLNYLFTSFYHPGIGQGVQRLGPWQQFGSNMSMLWNVLQDPNAPLAAKAFAGVAGYLYGGLWLGAHLYFAAGMLMLASPAMPIVAGTTLIGAGVGAGISYYQQGAYTNPNAQIDYNQVLKATLTGAEFGFMLGLGYATGMALEGAIASQALTATRAVWYGAALNIGTGMGWDMTVHGTMPSEAFLWNVAGFGAGELIGAFGERALRRLEYLGERAFWRTIDFAQNTFFPYHYSRLNLANREAVEALYHDLEGPTPEWVVNLVRDRRIPMSQRPSPEDIEEITHYLYRSRVAPGRLHTGYKGGSIAILQVGDMWYLGFNGLLEARVAELFPRATSFPEGWFDFVTKHAEPHAFRELGVEEGAGARGFLVVNRGPCRFCFLPDNPETLIPYSIRQAGLRNTRVQFLDRDLTTWRWRTIFGE